MHLRGRPGIPAVERPLTPEEVKKMRLRKIRRPLYILCTFFLLTPLSFGKPALAQDPPPAAPPPDPPKRVLRGEAATDSAQPTLRAAAATEWTLHKTADNLHPDDNEQQMLWLMNRARANPDQEGVWLATTPLEDVAGGRDYFDVNLPQLQAEFGQYAAKPPAAFDARLYAAAEAHTLDLIARDAQDHDGQFEAIADAGFVYTAARGNVFAYAASALNAHAAFNIDWGGTDGTGMQTGRGHRMAVMSIDGDYTNVGIAAVAKSKGDLVVTGNYCRADTLNAAHYNRFLVGTVWADANGNDMYDPGEGLEGITVRPDQGQYFAVTADSGGYAFPILAPGTYTVTFSGATLSGDVTRSVTIAAQSLLLDLLADDLSPPPDDGDSPSDDTGSGSSDGSGDGGGSGCFIDILGRPPMRT